MFSLLFVRTAPYLERPAPDLTARARIRDAAIECFAADGFEASFRTIAARAGVSPALITHHFGSKTALRAECDAVVLDRYRALKSDAVALRSEYLLGALTAPGTSPTLLVYLLRAILAGGSSARAFLDHLVDDMTQVMADGVASGLVRPSRDERARLRYLTHQTMGALAVQFVTMPGVTPEEFAASLHAGEQDTLLPMLELFTEGLLTDHRMLDDYVEYVSRSGSRPGTPTARPASPATATKAAARRHPARSRP